MRKLRLEGALDGETRILTLDYIFYLISKVYCDVSNLNFPVYSGEIKAQGTSKPAEPMYLFCSYGRRETGSLGESSTLPFRTLF